MTTLFVLCWHAELVDLETVRGYGYSIHPTKKVADDWKGSPSFPSKQHRKDTKALEEQEEIFLCGTGRIPHASKEILHALGGRECLFVTRKPEGFVRTSGKTPDEVDAEEKVKQDSCTSSD